MHTLECKNVTNVKERRMDMREGEEIGLRKASLDSIHLFATGSLSRQQC